MNELMYMSFNRAKDATYGVMIADGMSIVTKDNLVEQFTNDDSLNRLFEMKTKSLDDGTTSIYFTQRKSEE